MTRVPIAEQFYSIQGEGPYAGEPSVFLRLAGCNLSCGWESGLDEYEPGDDPNAEGATWVCDTIDVWRAAERTPKPGELVEEWEARGWLGALSRGAHLILTGGEPTLPKHQETTLSLVGELLRRDTQTFIEVETNGTLVPESEYARYVHQWNVSMKLSNSGMARDDRINEDAISFYKSVHTDRTDKDAIFKFVATGEDDVKEITELTWDYDIPTDMVSLMPAGQTQEQLRETYPRVAEVCKDKGWRFSPRLQVDTWNQATGV